MRRTPPDDRRDGDGRGGRTSAGESDKPPTGYRWEQFGEDLSRFLEVVGLEDVRAVGHSKGATAIAAAAPAGTQRLARAALIEPVLMSGSPATEPAWDASMTVGARRRRNVWPSRDAMFESVRGKMPFETWREDFVRLYVDHGVADRPDGQVELRCPGAIEAQVYAEAAMTDGFALPTRAPVAAATYATRNDKIRLLAVLTGVCAEACRPGRGREADDEVRQNWPRHHSPAAVLRSPSR